MITPDSVLELIQVSPLVQVVIAITITVFVLEVLIIIIKTRTRRSKIGSKSIGIEEQELSDDSIPDDLSKEKDSPIEKSEGVYALDLASSLEIRHDSNEEVQLAYRDFFTSEFSFYYIQSRESELRRENVSSMEAFSATSADQKSQKNSLYM